MVIAVDFDGTCVTHEFPKVGKDIGAVPVLKRLVEEGHQLILYTMRSFMPGISPVTKKQENGGLQDAIDWFKRNEIELFAIQTNPTQKHWTESPKCYAHMYIDDAALGIPLIGKPEMCNRLFVNWEAVELMLEGLGILKPNKVFGNADTNHATEFLKAQRTKNANGTHT